MVRKDIIERRNEKKAKGRPFEKGHVPHNKRKTASKILASDRHTSDDEGDTIEETIPLPREPLELGGGIVIPVEPDHNFESQIPADKKAEIVPEKVEPKSLELIESIDFFNGENKLSLRFSKRHNRMYRIQIFLNDELEIRPVTYTGAAPGISVWNLLKGTLKK